MKNKHEIFIHKGDLPANVTFDGDIAVDTETRGLNIMQRDRLCVVQISDGGGTAHLVQLFPEDYAQAENLKALLADEARVKLFHYARFDIAAIKQYLGVDVAPVYCTKIASKLCRTYSDRHGLKEICRELLEVDISKQQQSSNWGAQELSQAQVQYAASDVLYLHALRGKLDAMLEDEGRRALAQRCFDFLPTRVELDMRGWEEVDIFSHS